MTNKILIICMMTLSLSCIKPGSAVVEKGAVDIDSNTDIAALKLELSELKEQNLNSGRDSIISTGAGYVVLSVLIFMSFGLGITGIVVWNFRRKSKMLDLLKCVLSKMDDGKRREIRELMNIERNNGGPHNKLSKKDVENII